MVVLIVWIVVVVLALVVLGAIGYGVLGAAGRLGRELEAAERDVRPLIQQAQADGRPRREGLNRPAGTASDLDPTPSGVASPVPLTSGGPVMGSLGPLEIGLIILAILLLFGYKKLPDASRSLGRSLRIFKGEMKGMKDDDVRDAKDAAQTTPVRGEIVARHPAVPRPRPAVT